MTIPRTYLTSVKNVEGILNAIRAGQAPGQFTQIHLKNLGFASSSDRLIIPLLRTLGFLTDDGSPTQRYFQFLDQTESGRILAAAIREAYEDLFRINKKANDWSHTDVVNKLRTLTEGKYSDDVLSKMASTFKKLAELADWSSTESTKHVEEVKPKPEAPHIEQRLPRSGPPERMQLSYTISIELPASRDQAVYDAIFRSLKEHLLN